jgi:PIN domain nuclease of toxin-antitoxin system
VRLLLDTHALLWALADKRRLSSAARAAISEPANTILVSAVSLWEIAIKSSRGQMQVRGDLYDAIERTGFMPLPIGFAETRRIAKLPHHHGDPFDRMLIAQALEHGASLVTSDQAIEHYRVAIVW